MHIDYWDIAFNIASALLAGGLIGLERSFHGRPAGFRTHALVCMASAILMVVTSYQHDWFGGVPTETIRTDPTRMAQGIMTGIGFLGAGVIFKEGVTVRGLTTAASIWITAAIGILCGIGFYYPAALSTLVVLIVLTLLRRLEDRIPIQHYVQHVLRFRPDKVPSEADLRAMLEEYGFSISEVSYALVDGGSLFEYRAVIMTQDQENLARLAERLRKMDDLLEFRISPTGE